MTAERTAKLEGEVSQITNRQNDMNDRLMVVENRFDTEKAHIYTRIDEKISHAIDVASNSMKEHMDEGFNKITSAVIKALIYALGVLGTGFIGTLVYIFNTIGA